MRNLKDLTGKNFGRGIVVKYDFMKKGNRYWLLKCSCGEMYNAPTGRLNNGGVKSCGCLQKERVSKLFRKHGFSGTHWQKIWAGINSRCYDPKNRNYKNYGGRGIRCLWDSIECFYEDMKNGYTKGLTLDRINNNGDYCKENCRWATRRQQANNRRSSVYHKFKGEKRTLAQWCRVFDLKYSSVHTTLRRKNITFHEFMTRRQTSR